MYKNIVNSEAPENENNKSEVKDKIDNVKELGNTDLANPIGYDDKLIEILKERAEGETKCI